MTLHAGSQNGIALAGAINKRIFSALRTRDVGLFRAHYHLDRRKPIIEMVRNTACPFVVVEPLYLSNDADFEKIDIPSISIALVEGCIDYWEELT
jgi:N-acetylmuramoyl-L-alanine amidase